ncbi:MAG: alpha/beta hydrolase [Isosphaeraceae bacterium]
MSPTRLAAPLIAGLIAWGSIPASSQEPAVLPLYPDGPPGALGRETSGPNNGPGDVPTLTVWPAPKDRANGAAMVICPGGGYGALAINHEGKDVAAWLNSIGVSAFMLKYRLGPKYHHPIELQDAQRAIRTVRARAGEWGIDPKRVGILGFSAGGHLASTAITHFDAGKADAADPVERQSCRPDFAILGYPVIALATEYAHAGSRTNLLGPNPDPAVLKGLSNETQVTAETPPTFLVQTNEDKAVPAENSLLFVLALRKAGVPVEFHMFEKGRHGLGLGTGSPEHNITPDAAFGVWPKMAETWLKGRGLLEKARP